MSLKCPDCGLTLLSERGYPGHTTDKALGVFTRSRRCACGYRTRTVEMPASALAELRRKAYLYDRSQTP